MKSISPESFATFGDLLRYLRQREKLTQRELSTAIGYSESQINRLEHNLRLPELNIVAARFVPTLHLEDEPDVAARLIELAAEARGEPVPASITFTRSARRETGKEIGALVRKRRTNLPIQLTRFIGREGEVAELVARVSKARLLTLTGAGGVGKTRLALEAATGLLDTFADGVWLVELAALTEPALVSQTVASTLKLIEQPGRVPLDTVADYFEAKHTLLILDNCEHVIAACAELTVRLLQRCPELRTLATSRETLRVPGEVVYRVPSLTTPSLAHGTADLRDYESVQLFIERARASQPAFVLTSNNAAEVAQVCRRLDGIPLALELAAARLKVLSIEQIAARLDDRLSLLTSGVRTALPRQQTLRATIAWSVDLLTQPEHELLARLSVFAGGFTAEAAEAIFHHPQTFDLLTNLVDKSLVIADVRDESVRYRVLETIRQYAVEMLHVMGNMDAARYCHMVHFLAVADTAESKLHGREQIEWLNRLEQEHDNFRAALA